MKIKEIQRREFLKYTAALAAGSIISGRAVQAKTCNLQLKHALKYTMIPKNLLDEEKFKLVKRCGFDGIDGVPSDDFKAAEKQGKLARDIGVPFHGLVYGTGGNPLSDPDTAVVEKGIEGMRNALRCAKIMGATTVLLVPAVVTEKVRYIDAYKRSQENVAKLIPTAEETGVIIAIENVWNKFLLSPIEFAKYIDEFDNPYVRAYFDIGNVIIFGYAQDWIRTLGKRIVKLDVKDFKRRNYKWVNLGDGDVNWAETLKVLEEIGYKGWWTAELKGGDEKYLTDVAKRLKKMAE